MKYNFDDLYEGPRFQNRARRRKIKLIVSGIIGVLSLAVVIIAVSVFTGESEEAQPAPAADVEVASEKVDAENESVEEVSETNSDLEVGPPSTSDSNNHSQLEQVTGNKNLNQETSQTLGESEQESIPVNSEDWEPTPTIQDGPHVTDFTKGSQDWEEMMTAISGATGLSRDSMIVWWLGNGGGPDKAVSTVSPPDQQYYYSVQLEWIQGQGWKPVSVEQLEENDRKPGTDNNE